MPLLLFLGSPMHQGRTEQADSHPDKRLAETEPLQFLAIDQTLHHGRATAPIFLVPIDRDPSALVEFLVPSDARVPISVAFVGHDMPRRRRELFVRFEPLWRVDG